MAGEPPAAEAQGSTPDMDEWVEPPLDPQDPGAAAQDQGVNVPVGTTPV